MQYECAVTHSFTWCYSFVCVTWFVHVYHLIHSRVSRDSFNFWSDSFIGLTQGSFICVAWLLHLCDLTHPFVLCDALICVTHGLFVCVIRLICVCDSFMCVTRLIHLGDKAYSLRDLTHSFVWYDSWLRGDGCVNYILYIHIIIQLQGVQKLCVCVCVCVCTCVCMGVVVCVMYVWVCIYMSHVTHTYDAFHTYE